MPRTILTPRFTTFQGLLVDASLFRSDGIYQMPWGEPHNRHGHVTLTLLVPDQFNTVKGHLPGPVRILPVHYVGDLHTECPFCMGVVRKQTAICPNCKTEIFRWVEEISTHD